MGFSSAAGVILLLTTILACSIYLYSSVDISSVKVNEAYYKHTTYLENKLNEKLNIVEVVNSTDTINITLKNEGSVTLEPQKWDVLYNGTPKKFEVVSNKIYLTPLDNVTLTINATAPARICVVSEYGNQYFYRIN